MPEMNRHELNILLAANVNPQDILAVDKDAGKLATFTRKNLSPLERKTIRRRAALVSVACEEWVKEGVRLARAHFDFCGNLDSYSYGTVRAELEAIASCGIIDNARIAITFERGREGNRVAKTVDRIARAVVTLNNGLRGRATVEEVSQGRYQNGPSPMQWVVFEILGRTQ
jgi:hypothetical protein